MNFVEVTRDASVAFISRVVWCVPIGLRGTAAWHWLSLLPSKVRARDGLTGLLSRHEFNRRASSRLRRGGEHTLLYIDIDGLIYANDALGHVTGDAMLVTLARTLRRVASGELTARYGGDEFVVLVERRQRAEELAKRLRVAVALQFCAERTRTVAARPELAGKPLLTLSVGAARANPGESLPKLLQRVDAAMGAVKNAGRDCIAWA